MSFDEIRNPPMPEGFIDAWRAAGTHLLELLGDRAQWLNTSPYNNMGTHLTFRISSTLFFVFVETENRNFGDSSDLFSYYSSRANAIPCVIPMIKEQGLYVPQFDGSGLMHVPSVEVIDPFDFEKTELVEMSDWEVHDFAVQVVKDFIEKNGREIMNSQSNPDIDPNIWFRDEGEESYVIVGEVRYPEKRAEKPDNRDDYVNSPQLVGKKGFFASVGIANTNQQFSEDVKEIVPLWRGQGMIVNFEGLEDL